MREKKIRYEDRIRPWDKTHRCAGSLARHVSVRRDPRTQEWRLYHLTHDSESWGLCMCNATDIAFCPFCGLPLGDAKPELGPLYHSQWDELPNMETNSTDYADYIAYLALASGNAVYVQCEKCGVLDLCVPPRKPKYCRGCGARMDEEKGDANE